MTKDVGMTNGCATVGGGAIIEYLPAEVVRFCVDISKEPYTVAMFHDKD